MSFQILCATMNQCDFKKLVEMNIRSNVVFANQSNTNRVDETKFDNIHTAKMITTDTKGVGINRNICLMHANEEICLLADDDITYYDDIEDIILSEFNLYPDADVIIFGLNADNDEYAERSYEKTIRYRKYMKKPWGACRIAFRLKSVRKANVWFTSLFGGGTIYSCGEDSMWLNDVIKKGLKIWVSNKCIGDLRTGESTWYTGKNEYYYYGKGAYYKACYPKIYVIWMFYFALRTHGMTDLRFFERIEWMKNGVDGYKELIGYEEFRLRRQDE